MVALRLGQVEESTGAGGQCTREGGRSGERGNRRRGDQPLCSSTLATGEPGRQTRGLRAREFLGRRVCEACVDGCDHKPSDVVIFCIPTARAGVIISSFNVCKKEEKDLINATEASLVISCCIKCQPLYIFVYAMASSIQVPSSPPFLCLPFVPVPTYRRGNASTAVDAA
jgi:hypothetical protein